MLENQECLLVASDPSSPSHCLPLRHLMTPEQSVQQPGVSTSLPARRKDAAPPQWTNCFCKSHHSPLLPPFPLRTPGCYSQMLSPKFMNGTWAKEAPPPEKKLTKEASKNPNGPSPSKRFSQGYRLQILGYCTSRETKETIPLPGTNLMASQLHPPSLTSWHSAPAWTDSHLHTLSLIGHSLR